MVSMAGEFHYFLNPWLGLEERLQLRPSLQLPVGLHKKLVTLLFVLQSSIDDFDSSDFDVAVDGGDVQTNGGERPFPLKDLWWIWWWYLCWSMRSWRNSL